ncbi:hypothetical protein EVAR_47375_1 [Eumeta japonica]|uniref:Uncharacterized protein n=1 Tax=Eumeta variegata TaxID=151549 RepID=A0A4C1WUE1_EUMVA|nr:hypothetical protein EVAR_47375_1 [Eumeta japonica]
MRRGEHANPPVLAIFTVSAEVGKGGAEGGRYPRQLWRRYNVGASSGRLIVVRSFVNDITEVVANRYRPLLSLASYSVFHAGALAHHVLVVGALFRVQLEDHHDSRVTDLIPYRFLTLTGWMFVSIDRSLQEIKIDFRSGMRSGNETLNEIEKRPEPELTVDSELKLESGTESKTKLAVKRNETDVNDE